MLEKKYSLGKKAYLSYYACAVPPSPFPPMCMCSFLLSQFAGFSTPGEGQDDHPDSPDESVPEESGPRHDCHVT